MRKLVNFSWVIDNVLAGSSRPWLTSDLLFLVNNEIYSILNLTENDVYDAENDLINKFTIYHIPIPDFSVPTIDQIKKIWTLYLKIKKSKHKLLVHCIAGCGRTGTILAILLMFENKNSNVIEVINDLRKIRPCSIETLEQEQFIHQISKMRSEIINRE